MIAGKGTYCTGIDEEMVDIDIPGRAFLDTSVVNFMLDYGEQIHDNMDIPEEATNYVIKDILALRGIFLTGERACWQFAVSPITYKEIVSTRDLSNRMDLENWFFEIWNHWRGILEQGNDLPDSIDANRIRIEVLSSGVLDILPNEPDRILICDAIAYRCDCFCTRDWKTILRHREFLTSLPLKIVSPSEWWGLIKAHAALWY